jgi:hypothetical protein
MNYPPGRRNKKKKMSDQRSIPPASATKSAASNGAHERRNNLGPTWEQLEARIREQFRNLSQKSLDAKLERERAAYHRFTSSEFTAVEVGQEMLKSALSAVQPHRRAQVVEAMRKSWS